MAPRQNLLIIALLASSLTGFSQARIYISEASKDSPMTDAYKKDGWRELDKYVKDYPLYKVVKGDSLILEFATHFWYDQVREFAYRYVPLDSYPTDLTRGQVKAILKRIDDLESGSKKRKSNDVKVINYP